MVFLHAAWQVYKQYQLSFEEIDNAHILPKLVLPCEDKRVDPGLLVISARRNYPPWPCFESPPFRDNDALGQLETQAEEVIGLFCNNLNCILGWCPTSHLEPTTLPSQSPATVPSHRYFSLYEPCGKGCFRFSDARDDERDARWNDNELLMFEQCLRVLPDAAPCNLARLYQKPCREVFSQRRRLIPDSNIQGHPKRSTKGRRKNSLNTLDDSHARDLANWVPNEPCFHPGKSCEEAGDVCACVANFAYCQAACRCGIFPCRRRQKGCKCQKTDCQKAQCSCYKASRGCDPAVCRSCGQSGVEQGTCANRSLQRGTWKSLEVKESQWGRGTFSREDIPMRTFISEYIGDILLLQTAVTRFELSIHWERNYFFHLEKNSHVLDSTFVGNETRYINHGADEANCEARKCLVNGEYRVGFWAKGYC